MQTKGNFRIKTSSEEGWYFLGASAFFGILAATYYGNDWRSFYLLGSIAMAMFALAFARFTTVLELKDGMLTLSNPLTRSSVDLRTLTHAEKFNTPIILKYRKIIWLTDKDGRSLNLTPLDYSYKDFLLLEKYVWPYIFRTHVDRNILVINHYDSTAKIPVKAVVKAFAYTTVLFSVIITLMIGVALALR